MSLGLREIGILVLEKLEELHEKDPHASGIGFDEILAIEEFKDYKNKLKDAALLLEEDGLINCYRTNGPDIYAIGITTKGKLRLEERKENQTKPSEIEIIVKNLINEANPNRPHEMEITKTNEFYEKVNKLDNSELKVNFLNGILQGIEDYFLKRWTISENPRSFHKGYTLDYCQKVIKESELYQKIKRLVNKLIDDPNYIIPTYYKTFAVAKGALEDYAKNYKAENREYWENHLFIDVIEIKEYLNKLDDSEKKEFLEYHLHELNQICYHYPDDAIETVLNKHGLLDKFKRIKYSPMADYEHSNISKSEFSTFLRLLNKSVIPLLHNEKRRFKTIVDSIEMKNEPVNDIIQTPKKEMNTKAKNRIIWKGSIADLKELFQALRLAGLIEEITQPNAVIRDCFIKPDGNDFNEDTIRKTNIKGKSRNYDKIKQIANNVKKGK